MPHLSLPGMQPLQLSIGGNVREFFEGFLRLAGVSARPKVAATMSYWSVDSDIGGSPDRALGLGPVLGS